MSHVAATDLVVRCYECGPAGTVALPTVLSSCELARWNWILDPGLGLLDDLHRGSFFVVHRATLALARGFGIGTPVRVRAALREVGGPARPRPPHRHGTLKRVPAGARAAVTTEPFPSHEAPPSAGGGTFLRPAEPTYVPTLAQLVAREVPADAAEETVRVRASDCDLHAHVNNAAWLRMFEELLDAPAIRADRGFPPAALRCGRPLPAGARPRNAPRHTIHEQPPLRRTLDGMWPLLTACVHRPETALAPTPQAVAACRAAHPEPDLPVWDFATCAAVVTDAPPPPSPTPFLTPLPTTDMPGARPPARPEDVAARCAPGPWLSAEAAVCVARAAGLPDGKAEPTLQAAPALNAIVWSVQVGSADGRQRDVVVLDAVDGTVFRRSHAIRGVLPAVPGG